MKLLEFKGSPVQQGRASGSLVREHIARNITSLLGNADHQTLENDPGFKRWVDDQENVISEN